MRSLSEPHTKRVHDHIQPDADRTGNQRNTGKDAEQGGIMSIVILTCPECGADLEHIVFATYPPIPAWRCPKCGWKYEQRVKIERVPFEPPKEEN